MQLCIINDPDHAAFNVFSSPIAVYMAVRCITKEGAPIPLRDIPVLLASVQISFRLRAYHYLHNDHSLRMSTLDIQPQADLQVSDSGQATAINEPLQTTGHVINVSHHHLWVLAIHIHSWVLPVVRGVGIGCCLWAVVFICGAWPLFMGGHCL